VYLKILFLLVLSSVTTLVSVAQKDSSKSPLTISGYIDVYYSYDFSKPADHNRPPFIYSYNRSNEVNLNIGFIKASYNTSIIRANLAVMTGTYTNANLASEPGLLKIIYEANAGIKLHRSKNIWLDAGVFESHLGAESAIGQKCLNLTRSFAADNSPYFETGVKVTYTSDNTKWLLSGLFLNGWQRIQRMDGNNSIAVGHQLTFSPSSSLTINSSSFIGNDKPDTVIQMRYFHDLYSKFYLQNKLCVLAGFDIGMEQNAPKSNRYHIWYTPYLMLQYPLSDKLRMGLRGEYYSDKNQVIIHTNTANGFQTFGYSINADYAIYKNVLCRIEARTFNSRDAIFMLNNKPDTDNYCITTSIAVAF
jgi:hypothetical protein